MKLEFSNVYSLNWGPPYLDHYSNITRNATIILNVSFQQNDLDDIFRYALSQVLWAFQEVPKGTLITVLFDIRGQLVSKVDFRAFEKKMKESLRSLLGKQRFFIVFKS
ncbi:hypothetical protein [Chitinophaga silvisoli]|uniref:Uncharacterized protein n=1 Tax=Chitinophaga silvisoli TaxID=2291814 RepID=A0A3E1NZ38_9BACT|nr:hypothetical protein [Chitinophaga silvisoli]RFM33182.1 hypothetical protein DXN04_19315 [Chitinophaga silvisoli]